MFFVLSNLLFFFFLILVTYYFGKKKKKSIVIGGDISTDYSNQSWVVVVVSVRTERDGLANSISSGRGFLGNRRNIFSRNIWIKVCGTTVHLPETGSSPLLFNSFWCCSLGHLYRRHHHVQVSSFPFLSYPKKISHFQLNYFYTQFLFAFKN